MSDITKIEWATSTGNPWIGCTKVSPGCKNCYAEKLDDQRFSKTMGGGSKENPVSHWGKGAPRFKTKGFWKDALRWNETPNVCGCCDQIFSTHDAMHHRHGTIIPSFHRPRIFPSLCDWLDNEVPIAWFLDFLLLMFKCQYLDWLLLSKRVQLFESRMRQALDVITDGTGSNAEFWQWIVDWLAGNPPQNVWVGTSVEDQQRADERILDLLEIPATIRFLSVEPLLGPIGHLDLYCDYLAVGFTAEIDWVIVGGESGKQARRCNIEWIRSIVSQCKAASVPCFVKQLGGNLSDSDLSECDRATGKSMAHPKGGDPSEWPEDLRVRQFPK